MEAVPEMDQTVNNTETLAIIFDQTAQLSLLGFHQYYVKIGALEYIQSAS